MKGKVIVAFTDSGYTARTVARYRPRVPILVLTQHQETYNQTLIVYGCEPILIKKVKNLIEAQKVAKKIVEATDLARKDDLYVLGAGVPFGAPGATNTMIVEKI